MTSLIVASEVDPAAQTISAELRRLKNFQEVGSTELFRSADVYLKHVRTEGIYTEKLGVGFRPDVVIFASKHRSESHEPALTVHWTGNPTSRADLGGKPKSLSQTDPIRLRTALLALDTAREQMKLNYAVTLEATHHGPTELETPTLFVEVGSTEKEWRDSAAGAAAAEAIWAAATAKGTDAESAVGFGGGHYCNKQCNALREEGYAFSHIFSKYFFDEYDSSIVDMAYDRTTGGCKTAVIDWKGIRSPERRRLLDDLEREEVEIVRV
ncbi:MAG TPA: D-aminoacyl-tRNA deacylase [archaeon]|nr:D-aminoacyl-tRNA deacylase [archaeon]